jgi:hypothetical protein
MVHAVFLHAWLVSLVVITDLLVILVVSQVVAHLLDRDPLVNLAAHGLSVNVFPVADPSSNGSRSGIRRGRGRCCKQYERGS